LSGPVTGSIPHGCESASEAIHSPKTSFIEYTPGGCATTNFAAASAP
jgi:hypothetical protein